MVEGRSWASAFEGRYSQLAGRTPENKQEIMLSPGALKRLGLKIGDQLKVNSTPVSAFKIVGVLKAAIETNASVTIYADAAAISRQPTDKVIADTKFYLAGLSPRSWHKVLQLNKLGIGAYSREVVLNPPPPAEDPLNSTNYYGTAIGYQSTLLSTANLVAALILVPLVLLPVFVLAGSAFSFGARRQARTLAVLASLGAPRKTLRSIMIANGFWLGALGGLVGDAIGIVLAAIFMPITADGSSIGYPGLHLNFAYYLALIAAGSAIGALVSLVPAISASKVNILSTLRGLRSQGRKPKLAGLASLFVIGLGVAGSLYFVQRGVSYKDFVAKNGFTDTTTDTQNALGLLASAATTFVGLLIGSSWLIIAARALFRKFGVAANYATNDLLYNRKRFTPVIASVLVTTFVGSTIMVLLFSFMTLTSNNYRPRLEPNQLAVSGTVVLQDPNTGSFDLAETKKRLNSMRSTFNGYKQEIASTGLTHGVAVIDQHMQMQTIIGEFEGAFLTHQAQPVLRANYDLLCPWVTRNPENLKRLAKHDTSNWQTEYMRKLQAKKGFQCGQASQADQIQVGDAKTLRSILGGRVDRSAEATLLAGGAVVIDPVYLNNGKVFIDWLPEGESGTEIWGVANNGVDAPVFAKPQKTATLKAVQVSSANGLNEMSNNHFTVLIAAATAEKLGISHQPWYLLATFKQPLTADYRDRLNAMFGEYRYDYEGGSAIEPEGWAWGLLAGIAFLVLSSTMIALGLAQIESRADQNTLSSVGAPKGFRGRVLAIQALTLTLFGTALGALTAIVLAWSILTALAPKDYGAPGQSLLSLPLLQGALLIFGVPLTAAISFWVVTPRRLKYRARLSLD